MNGRRKPLLWLFLSVFAGTLSIVTVAGCNKEEKTESGYYTGPMKKKGGGGVDAPGTPGAPAPATK